MPESFKVHGAGRKEFGTRHVRPQFVKPPAPTITPVVKRSSTALGYGYRWQVFREWWLRRNPLCVACKKKGRIVEATVVDHIVPHKGDMKLFWDSGNFQALCVKCHATKTASEDGGFGNVRKGIPNG